MKDEFEEMVEEMNLNEVEDFDAKPATYQFWMLGYDENQNITDYEFLVNESKDAEYTVALAKKFVNEEKYKMSAPFPEDVVYIEFIVETVVDYEDHTENVGTLFTETIKIK